MRLIRGLLIGLLAMSWLAGCSDDTTSTKKDKGVIQDVGGDVAPTPDGGTDQLVTPDGPMVDGPMVDQGTIDLPKTDAIVVTPDQGGPVGDQGPQAAGVCATAPLVALTAGSATISDDTSKYTDQFSGLTCRSTTSTTSTLDAPQAYYRIAGKQDQWYRFVLKPSFSSAYMYAFTNNTCTEATIATDCQSAGVTGASSRSAASSTSPRAMYFKSPAAADVRFGVDSTFNDGAFTLDVEELALPTNATCATATPLVFFNGKATLRGDTHETLTPDEFPAVKCGTITMDGPQAYYKFDATVGKSYKISVKSDAGYLQHFYVFGSTCTEAAISTDCSSAGATGLTTTSSFSGGTTRQLVFTPTTSGTYHIAIDSTENYGYGPFTLTVEDFTPPGNGTCAAAAAITLTAGKATINGGTLGLKDEYATVNCGGFTAFDGPQAYYEFVPTAGKYYKVTLEPTFSAYAYWFKKASCGTAAAINTDCGTAASGGKIGSISSGSTGSMIIANQSAPVLIAVDSSDPGTAGDFELTIEEVVPPANDTCATATALTLVGGTVSVSGDNSLATDQSNLPASGCTGGATPGAELFYSVAVQAGKTYSIRIDATFDSAPYILDGCTTATCLLGVDDNFSSGLETMIYKPTADATIIIVVDPYSATGRGTFTLDVTEVVAPTNDTCATATPITLTAGKGSVTGDTTLATNALSLSSSSCTGDTTPGNELFYSIPVTANVPVTVQVDAAFDSVLYVLEACAATPVCLAGADDGTSGIESLTFTPTATGTVIIGVDGYDTPDFGAFTLSINP